MLPDLSSARRVSPKSRGVLMAVPPGACPPGAPLPLVLGLLFGGLLAGWLEALTPSPQSPCQLLPWSCLLSKAFWGWGVGGGESAMWVRHWGDASRVQ